MPDTTREAVQKIIDLKGVTQELLAARLGVNRKALNKWCMQDRMSINHMVGICVALKLRPDIAEELVRLTGYYWRNNKHDNLLHMMLYCAADLSVERCNEILQQEGYPKLNEGKDDSWREFWLTAVWYMPGPVVDGCPVFLPISHRILTWNNIFSFIATRRGRIFFALYA